MANHENLTIKETIIPQDILSRYEDDDTSAPTIRISDEDNVHDIISDEGSDVISHTPNVRRHDNLRQTQALHVNPR